MHTLVVTMTTDPSRPEDVRRHLRDDVTAWAKQQHGFVSGEWLLSDSGEAGIGLVVFESREAADRAAAGPRHHAPRAERPWNINRVTVYEPIASAIA